MTLRLLKFMFVLGFLVSPKDASAQTKHVVFEDSFRGRIDSSWHWLRERPGFWRNSPEGLEIRVEPGLAPTVKNALVRKAPNRSQGTYHIEVAVEFTAPPTNQYEQAGITWYQGGKPVFKLVHELIDGKTYIIPGKKPAENRLVHLRLVVTKDHFIAEYVQGLSGPYQTAAEGKLPPGKDEEISIQCYNGPPAPEHWMRFSNFRVVKLLE
jgi:hypothetical protein